MTQMSAISCKKIPFLQWFCCLLVGIFVIIINVVIVINFVVVFIVVHNINKHFCCHKRLTQKTIDCSNPTLSDAREPPDDLALRTGAAISGDRG